MALKLDDFETYFTNRIKTFRPFLDERIRNKKCTLTPMQKKVIKWVHERVFGVIKTQRKTGMSTLMAAYATWQLYTNKKVTNVLILCHKNRYCQELYGKITDILKESPSIVVTEHHKNKLFKYYDNGQEKKILFLSSPKELIGQTFDLVLIPEAAWFKEDVFNETWPKVRSKSKRIFVWSTPAIEEDNVFRKLFENTEETSKASVYIDNASWKQMYDEERSDYVEKMKGIFSKPCFVTEVEGNFYTKEKNNMDKKEKKISESVAEKYVEATKTALEHPEFTATYSDAKVWDDEGYLVEKKCDTGEDKALSGVFKSDEKLGGKKPVKALYSWEEKEDDTKFNKALKEENERLRRKLNLMEAERSSDMTINAISKKIDTNRCKELMNHSGETIHKTNNQPSIGTKEMMMKIWSDADSKAYYTDPNTYKKTKNTEPIKKKLFKVAYDNGSEAGYYYIAADFIEDVFNDITKPCEEHEIKPYITGVVELKDSFKVL